MRQPAAYGFQRRGLADPALDQGFNEPPSQSHAVGCWELFDVEVGGARREFIRNEVDSGLQRRQGRGHAFKISQLVIGAGQ
jgi:hypothetical protein